MAFFNTLKRNSKLALKESWGRAILVLLIYFAVKFLLHNLFFGGARSLLESLAPNPTMESISFSSTLQAVLGSRGRLAMLSAYYLLTFLVIGPLELGVFHWYRSLVHGRSLPVSGIFHHFQRVRLYMRCVWYYLNLSVRSLLWGVLFHIVPAGIAGVSLYYLRQGGDRVLLMLATIGLCFSAVLALLASVLFLIFLNRYALVSYLLCEDESMPVLQAIRTSVGYTKGYRVSLFLFELSFIGWLLLTALTLGLAGIFTAPYMWASCAMYSRYIIEKNRYVPPDTTREFVPVEQRGSQEDDSSRQPTNEENAGPPLG